MTTTYDMGSSFRLNAPSGAQCFPTLRRRILLSLRGVLVSMHLLVLSAFRPKSSSKCPSRSLRRLNAPSGAQCFPTGFQLDQWQAGESQCTFWCSVLSDNDGPVLNEVLSASQCTFWCSVLSDGEEATHVLLFDASQCTFWCSVLSDPEEKSPFIFYVVRSQCTFWCSVLSDSI